MGQVVEVALDREGEEKRAEGAEGREPEVGRATGAVAAGQWQGHPGREYSEDGRDDPARERPQEFERDENEVRDRRQQAHGLVVPSVDRDDVVDRGKGRQVEAMLGQDVVGQDHHVIRPKASGLASDERRAAEDRGDEEHPGQGRGIVP